MSEKIEFIPAKDLPVAEGDEVDVLCVENGELKRKEGASLGGGSVAADMIITVNGMSSIALANGNYEITEGSIENVFKAFHEGRYPVLKIRFHYNENDAYSATREEYTASVCTYGEVLWFGFMVSDPYSAVNLKVHKVYMNSDGTISGAVVRNVSLS